MMCPKCRNEMRSGYLFSSKDDAFRTIMIQY